MRRWLIVAVLVLLPVAGLSCTVEQREQAANVVEGITDTVQTVTPALPVPWQPFAWVGTTIGAVVVSLLRARSANKSKEARDKAIQYFGNMLDAAKHSGDSDVVKAAEKVMAFIEQYKDSADAPIQELLLLFDRIRKGGTA